MKYAYSDNEEFFQGEFDTIEEALDEALDCCLDAETIYIGEVNQRTISDYVSEYTTESLLECLADAALDECGDIAQEWLYGPSVPRRQAGELEDVYAKRIQDYRSAKKARLHPLTETLKKVLEVWADAEGEQPRFWHASNVREFSVEAAQEYIYKAKNRPGELDPRD